jgi:hypothetical protein
MVMAMANFDGQVATFAYPGSTLGAMGSGAQGSAVQADAEVGAGLRAAEPSAYCG